MNPRVAILGGGLFGQTIAKVVCATGAQTRLWARRTDVRERLTAENAGLLAAASVAEAAMEAEVVIIAVPASAMRDVVAEYGEVARGDQIVLHAIRGVCPGERLLLPHRVVREETCVRKIGVLGGPLFAPALTQQRPLAAVLASRFDETFTLIEALTRDTPVRIHRSRDVAGVEIAGAISNVTALAVGMASGLELGETVRGVLLTRGLNEAARLGRVLGAESRTFAGLAGVGDLIPRRIGATQRHHEVGAALARGDSLAEVLEKADGEVEGVFTASAALAEAQHHGIDLVLTHAVADVVTGKRSAADAVEDVLQRDLELGLM